jgi:molecular chaperone DnaK
MSKIIGIDLGTTNSVVAVMEAASPRSSPTSKAPAPRPSVVALHRGKGERLVGAARQAPGGDQPQNTIYSIKRFMGRRHSEVGSEEKMVPYEITGGADELVKVDVRGKPTRRPRSPRWSCRT